MASGALPGHSPAPLAPVNVRPKAWLAQACYFASQAADKALKSMILELDEEPPHTHVLGDLVRQLQAAGLDTSALAPLALKALSRMTITSRYPIETTPPAELFDPVDAEQAIGTAAAVIEALAAMDQAPS
ncbi:HEPN domain-containing protein [Synechococcus sp. CS-1325]|nr:HEPN domain-containing protein [Synechococcus sp. CS-1325]MCT0233005.1 HEPN domain-containing protein [Synechococcus sp. CS-1327]